MSKRSATLTASRPAASVAKLSSGQTLETVRARFEALIHVAERNLANGQRENVLLSAAVAANYAARLQTGLVNDAQLEDLVIHAMRGQADAPVQDSCREAGRVLHVLQDWSTKCGQSELVLRWIRRDHRASDIVLTDHIGALPDDLTSSVALVGGTVLDLGKKLRGTTRRALEATMLERVQALRVAMDAADIVVIHDRVCDPVTIAAANLPGSRPPIILANPSERGPRLGLSTTNVIACEGASGLRQCHDSRGIALNRLAVLPRPAERAHPMFSRLELRARMHFDTNAVVALCVAAPQNLDSGSKAGFIEMAERLLKALPELTIIVIGPNLDGKFKRVALRFPGRLHALGPLPWASAFYVAADLYLDSFPISSSTALLDAAASGLPVVRYLAHEHLENLGAERYPGLAGSSGLARTADDYFKEVRRLTKSATARAEQSAAVQQSVSANHGPTSWTAQLESLYRQARSVKSTTPMELRSLVQSPADLSNEVVAMTFEDAIGSRATLIDSTLRAELYAAWISSEDEKRPTRLLVRARPGWENKRPWALRAFALAAAHSQLAISLPPVRGANAATTLELLLSVLAEAGLDAESCSDVAIEPAEDVGEVFLNMPNELSSLEFVEQVLHELARTSHVWSGSVGSARHTTYRPVSI